MRKKSPRGTILITGCSSGLGYHLVELFLGQGYAVIGLTRNPEPMESMSRRFLSLLSLRRCDITVPSQVEKIFASFDPGEVDILINNVGYGQVGPLELQQPKEVERQFRVNVFSLIHVTNSVIPAMRERRRGKIIHIGSSAGFIASPYNGLYAATKHAIEALTDSLRLELHPFGIQVTCLELGKLKTPYNLQVTEVAQTMSERSEIYRPAMQSFASTVQATTGMKLALLDRRLLRIAEAKNLSPRYFFDTYTRLLYLIKKFLPRLIYDYLMRKKNRL